MPKEVAGISENEKGQYVCVNCSTKADEIYHKYSETVLKLNKCISCGELVDKYVEYDVVLILLDLLLQNLAAYRHVLFNSGLKSYWRLATVFILCDSYSNWIQRRVTDASTPNNTLTATPPEIYDLEWCFYLSVLESLLKTTFFVGALLLLMNICDARRRHYADDGRRQRQSGSLNNVELVKRTLVGFYGNVLVVLAIIWQLHQNVSYVVLTQAFIFLSHVQIFRALKNVDLWTSILVIFGSTIMQHFCGRVASSFLWSLQ